MPHTPHAALPLLGELLLFCAIAGVLIPIVRRLHFSQVLAFLVVGALLGPYGLGGAVSATSPWRHFTITDLGGARQIAEFGVVFLLFTLGLEMSVERLWALRRWVFGLGNVQILVTAAIIAALAWHFDNPPAAAVVLGLALALSSTAIVMQLLAERHALGTEVGRVAFAILLMQDLMVVPLLVLVGHLGGHATALGPALLLALGKAAVAVGAIALVGRRVVQPLFHRVAQTHQADAFMALTLLVTLGTAALTWASGLSFALGAFLAGLLLGETTYRHQIALTIEPFRGLFIGVFFLSVGMGIDLRTLGAEPLWIPLSVGGLFVLKSVVATVAIRGFGLAWPIAIEAGCLLGQGGEFAFIVIGMAMTEALLPPEVGQFMLIVVGFSMLLAPPFARLGRTLGRFAASAGTPALPPAAVMPTLRDHVVIAGFGRVGQLLGEILDREGIQYLAIDRDAERVVRLHAAGAPVYFGDAEHPDLLPGTLVDGALAVVITLDEPEATARIATHLRARAPSVLVLARARDERHAMRLQEFGVQRVVPETLEAALQLSGHVLEALGYTADAVLLRLQLMREARLADLVRPPAAAAVRDE
ncbi:MAG: cation:proton antiporter [Gammaproteobacteria bacterium]